MPTLQVNMTEIYELGFPELTEHVCFVCLGFLVGTILNYVYCELVSELL